MRSFHTSLVYSGLVLAASSSLSFAADLPAPIPAQPAVPPALPQAFSWTGIYLGGTVGGSFDNKHTFENTGNSPFVAQRIQGGFHPGTITNSSSGVTGGGEIGFNYQIPNSAVFGTGGVVAGVEGDFESLGSRATTVYMAPPPAPTDTFRSRTSDLGTVRGRLGYAFGSTLIYGTGGWAWGNVQDDYNITSPSGNLHAFNNRSAGRSGYAAGGGLAYAIPGTAFIAKVEYLHYDLGRDTMFVSLPNPANSITSRIGVTGNLVRFGLDFKFL